ncbi:Flagellar biosynthetic protein FliP precursor [Gemmata obscuriglobus]|uniref:Flagellar biosynthetic protein FliP n=1 Tax=Gemmata obscuriglobus TaxID=114 RepID=A0A2Z3H2B6_9BACT|nr:flagellar type III secretion system pore protein FliP [Gemmata obscuriglobus]AWM37275.1 flagellar biosynthetic protein FliP [Gemmata obscuriglobus]QEG29979.1 Flagellar biosynthetic protein FliP precursor [Gemmata obscuriglobus]VTS09298.1 flagellar biosynthetic protein : Flagellar biosynthetic protein FliP OS=uncultured planctomycete GN=HGMM_F11F07C18 PE=3 SV=1: FliP [Gemmata obscuriglobus UQM 2246]
MGDLADFVNGPNGLNFQNLSPPVQTALMLGLSALLPAALMTMTCFTRVVIVLSFVRQGLGAQNVPPNLVLTGLALFITLFVMQPTFAEIDQKAYQPYLQKQITGPQAFKTGTDIYKQFMLRQTRKQDLALFLHLSKHTVEKAEDAPFLTVVPAFLISELKTAFIMGFCIYLPFLMVDLVVSSVLTSMGMVMMPPVTISAPFKILLFVLADGWHLVTYAIALSYG